MTEETIQWREPVAGFKFEPETVVISREYQQEKLGACGLSPDTFGDQVDASFYIGIGIRTGIRSGISAEGNVNMLTRLIQHRPVLLDEELTAKGEIMAVTQVPRGYAIDTEVHFYNLDGQKAISTIRRSLKPDPDKPKSGAGDRPAPVIEVPGDLRITGEHLLTPDQVCDYSTEGNSIHYEMEAANKAGFRAPIIGGGMGVHYLLAALRHEQALSRIDLDIYFRRPIFWDHRFSVGLLEDGGDLTACALVSDGKVLTEARILQIA